MKHCAKCNKTKDLNAFHKNSQCKDGLRPTCKECRRPSTKIYYINNKEKIDNYKKRYLLKNKQKVFLQHKLYQQKNKDKINLYHRNYYKKNHSKIRKYFNSYNKSRRKTDINFKLSCNLRTRLYCAIRGNYKAGSAIKDLGCSIKKFKIYIASLWKDGMNWSNYGKWHLDHKIPLSKFNLKNRNEFLKACHYSNIQP